MRLEWLGQQTVTLPAGHVFRARFLVPGLGGDFPCPIPDARALQAQNLLDSLGTPPGSPYSRADWGPWDIFTLPGGLLPDWPADRRDVPAAMNPSRLCGVWAQSTAQQDVQLPIDLLRSVLAPVNGVLLNFWDETSGQRIWDQPGATAPPLPPVLPPPVVTPLPPIQPPLPPTRVTPPDSEKKTSPIVVAAVVGAVAVGAILLLR